jgi:hypothetical protein
VYNLNYTPTGLGVQSCREITSGGTRTKSLKTTGLDYERTTDGSGFHCRRGKETFHFSITAKPTPEPTKSLVRRVPLAKMAGA